MRVLFFCHANTAATMQKLSSPARATPLSCGKVPMPVCARSPTPQSRYENGVLSFRPDTDTGAAPVCEIADQNRIP